MSAEGGRFGASQTLLTPDEAAAYLRICPKTLRSIRHKGLIRYVAVTARKIFYRPEDCDAYLASCIRTEIHTPTQHRRSSKKSTGPGNVVSFSARRRERLAERGRA